MTGPTGSPIRHGARGSPGGESWAPVQQQLQHFPLQHKAGLEALKGAEVWQLELPGYSSIPGR